MSTLFHPLKGSHVPADDTNRPARLLIVEDDLEIATMVAKMLGEHGYQVQRLPDGRDLERALKREPVDLVILDLMLPGEDGLSICRRLRKTHAMPVLMLTALGGEADRVIGLESGADDYLCKPFAPRELLARVRALLRRAKWVSGPTSDDPSCFVFDGWQLDLLRMNLYAPDRMQVPLTSAEFALLSVFCRKPQQVLSREALLALMHNQRAAVFDRAIDTLIARLRRKIEDDLKEPSRIKTVRNGGYIFTPQVEAATRETLP
jgi:two-component system OmpR family response regulator